MDAVRGSNQEFFGLNNGCMYLPALWDCRCFCCQSMSL
ncbi:hypothetical protein Goarm_006150 [Gossypium armourianum]|uniref:Uncharacterized protein n=1 Tax=Gossypium armourianum TaxID=34283 RepID=A0A7J9JH41_9ROSI|nr:hypothetical protein [Gossypium armourianum]